MLRNSGEFHLKIQQFLCVPYGSVLLGELIKLKIHMPYFKPAGFFFFNLFRATPMPYGGSQAQSPIGATAAGVRQSHSNARSEPCLQTIPQLMATPDP